MKVIRDDEWRLIGFDNGFKAEGAFVFEHKRFGDIMILQKVKYIIKELNIVLFFDALAEKVVSVSNQCRAKVREIFPSLADAVNEDVSIDNKIKHVNSVLQAAAI